jgi:hypothetical protein
VWCQFSPILILLFKLSKKNLGGVRKLVSGNPSYKFVYGITNTFQLSNQKCNFYMKIKGWKIMHGSNSLYIFVLSDSSHKILENLTKLSIEKFLDPLKYSRDIPSEVIKILSVVNDIIKVFIYLSENPEIFAS